MNGERSYLLDTNAVVSLLRGDNAILHLTREATFLTISVITHIEFLAFPHIAKEDVELFHAFLARVDVMNITHQDARLIKTAIDLRRTYSLKLPDAVIVASVLCKDAILVTADRKLLSLAGRVTGLRIHPLTA
jgi:tRNA(fMet)-specific endonuclease VapC